MLVEFQYKDGFVAVPIDDIEYICDRSSEPVGELDVAKSIVRTVHGASHPSTEPAIHIIERINKICWAMLEIQARRS